MGRGRTAVAGRRLQGRRSACRGNPPQQIRQISSPHRQRAHRRPRAFVAGSRLRGTRARICRLRPDHVPPDLPPGAQVPLILRALFSPQEMRPNGGYGLFFDGLASLLVLAVGEITNDLFGHTSETEIILGKIGYLPQTLYVEQTDRLLSHGNQIV